MRVQVYTPTYLIEVAPCVSFALKFRRVPARACPVDESMSQKCDTEFDATWALQKLRWARDVGPSR